MRTAFNRTAVLALLAPTACLLAASAGSAQASTGGVAYSHARSSIRPHRAPRAALATWFGPGFYGQRTACGQTLTAAVVGVAHRTLPCGTLVSISYRGRRLTLPVIDRGPYANGADWDLTIGAARALGIEDTARIGARVVGSAPNGPTLGLPPPTPAVAPTGGAAAG